MSWSDGDGSDDEVKAKYTNHVSTLTCRIMSDTESCEEEIEGEKNHKKGGLNCVFENFFFYILKNCSQVQSQK